MSDKIQDSYRQSRNIYDDVLTRSTWWSRVYMDLFWNGVDDNEIARKVLSYIPDNFAGKLLDVPVGTGVFTAAKYVRMNRADIICLDYSQDMLKQARVRFRQERIGNCRLIQGDVGALPFPDASFDIVLSMNGFHAFPDKEKAYSEVFARRPPRRLLLHPGRVPPHRLADETDPLPERLVHSPVRDLRLPDGTAFRRLSPGRVSQGRFDCLFRRDEKRG